MGLLDGSNGILLPRFFRLGIHTAVCFFLFPGFLRHSRFIERPGLFRAAGSPLLYRRLLSLPELLLRKRRFHIELEIPAIGAGFAFLCRVSAAAQPVVLPLHGHVIPRRTGDPIPQRVRSLQIRKQGLHILDPRKILRGEQRLIRQGDLLLILTPTPDLISFKGHLLASQFHPIGQVGPQGELLSGREHGLVPLFRITGDRQVLIDTAQIGHLVPSIIQDPDCIIDRAESFSALVPGDQGQAILPVPGVEDDALHINRAVRLPHAIAVAALDRVPILHRWEQRRQRGRKRLRLY